MVVTLVVMAYVAAGLSLLFGHANGSSIGDRLLGMAALVACGCWRRPRSRRWSVADRRPADLGRMAGLQAPSRRRGALDWRHDALPDVSLCELAGEIIINVRTAKAGRPRPANCAG